MVLHDFPLWSLSVALGAFWVPPGCLPGASGCFLGAFWVPLGALCAWMPGCQDAWMPGCLDAWMPAWMPGCLKSMICLSKILNFTFLNFLAIRLVPYSILSHSFFNPHLSSLVPSKIVQVELEEHGVKFKIYEQLKKMKNNMYEIEVLGCRDEIPRCRLCSYTLCHQF